MLAERACHLDYQPADLLHLELCQSPRRYEATMTDGQVLILPSVTQVLGGSSEGFTGNEATRIGTTVHDYIARCERAFGGLAAELCQEDPQAQHAFGLWASWRGAAGMLAALPILVEVPVCSIRHGYAGTLDLLYLEPGGPVLHDHKTSVSLRDEALIQVVAYARALDEMLEVGSQPAGVLPYGSPAAAQVGRFGKACREPEIRRVERSSWGPLWRRFVGRLEAR